ncbi:MAG TPA: HAMP domain-containing sensor histidine kinase [Thermomicrobiaceae bacterium]|nr:HAMP domain-containing sensor histidine kinase [Thermomicrobiaceae bacterium]
MVLHQHHVDSSRRPRTRRPAELDTRGQSDVVVSAEWTSPSSSALHHRRALDDPEPALPQQSQRALASEIVGRLGHELRTPLTTVQALAELLADPELPAAERVTLLEQHARSVCWMTNLLDDFSTWAAAQDGHLVLRCRETRVLDWVERAVILTQPFLARRAQRVRVNCPDPALSLYGDPERLSQVLVNLLTNAGRYSVWGDVIELCVEERDGREVRVSITDHGPGIPPEVQQRLFERYQRGLGAGQAPHGQGLGLYIVRTLVELHGGRVGIESAPGAGCTFWVALPHWPHRDGLAPCQLDEWIGAE